MSRHIAIIIILNLLFLSFTACKEEIDIGVASEQFCQDNNVFDCLTDEFGESFFRGNINGQDICLSDIHESGYKAQTGIGTLSSSSVSGNTTTIDESASVIATYHSYGLIPPFGDSRLQYLEEFSEMIRLHTPLAFGDSILDEHFFVDEFLKLGDLELRGGSNLNPDGFHFIISWNCVRRPGIDHYEEDATPGSIPEHTVILSPTYGPNDDAVFRLVKKEEEQFFGTTRYLVGFEIDCDLYWGPGGRKGEFFGRLENGIFEITFEI